MMTTSYSEILARNIRIARARGRVSQEATGMRMSSLGFTAWHRQTMGKAERGERRLTAEEILGLAVVLETSVGALLSPEADDGAVAFPAGMAVGAVSVRRSVRGTRDDGIAWQD